MRKAARQALWLAREAAWLLVAAPLLAWAAWHPWQVARTAARMVWEPREALPEAARVIGQAYAGTPVGETALFLPPAEETARAPLGRGEAEGGAYQVTVTAAPPRATAGVPVTVTVTVRMLRTAPAPRITLGARGPQGLVELDQGPGSAPAYTVACPGSGDARCLPGGAVLRVRARLLPRIPGAYVITATARRTPWDISSQATAQARVEAQAASAAPGPEDAVGRGRYGSLAWTVWAPRTVRVGQPVAVRVLAECSPQAASPCDLLVQHGWAGEASLDALVARTPRGTYEGPPGHPLSSAWDARWDGADECGTMPRACLGPGHAATETIPWTPEEAGRWELIVGAGPATYEWQGITWVPAHAARVTVEAVGAAP